MGDEQIDHWPVLDLALLASGEKSALEHFSRELRAACETIGFYFLENYEAFLPQAIIQKMLDASARAHALPRTEKEAWWLDASDSGFMPMGATTRWGSKGRPKLPEHEGCNEAFLFWGNGPPWVLPERQLRSIDENNILVEEKLPGFRAAVKEYLEAVERLARAMLPAYALALEQTEDFFDGKFDRPCWALRLNYYPPNDGKEVGIPPHADGDFCTFLLQDDQPGLSVLRADGQWVQAPTRGANSILVNSGNTLMRLSNDRFPSTMHSASCLSSGPQARARLSVPFFWSPSVDVTIEPLAAFISANEPAKYAAKQSGNVYSSGRVGKAAESDPERQDARAETFDHPGLSKKPRTSE
mmetsp:Transcript_76921/g.135535  ORF Transcript_76921/g.135535 Transcript_76921/m.135535 type:complete len:356 (-) Transcript_76921:39-1106(-)